MMVIYTSITVTIYATIIKTCRSSWSVGLLISVHSIFIRSYTDMLTKERNLEGKFPTDQLCRHVLRTVKYTVIGFPTVNCF